MIGRLSGLLLLAWACCGSVQAQHETGFDVLDGKQVFQQVCANCHGPDGDLIAGVDLGHGNFRQPYTDEQLVQIILQGIANTPMPPNPTMSEAQARQIVSYLRSLALGDQQTTRGDSSRGRALFAGRGACLSCHRVAGEGSGLGPELTRIGQIRTSMELLEALLRPEARVQPENRFYAVVTSAGEQVRGRLLNHDAFTVQLLDTEQRLRAFDKASLSEFGFSDPGMPALGPDYSSQEVADLVAYLASLRGSTP